MTNHTAHLVGDVFTPSSYAELTFVDREAVNARLVDSLRTKGKQLVVYGHSGCGKSTLLENKLKQTYDRHIRTGCMSGMSVSHILEDALIQLGVTYKSEEAIKTTDKISGSISPKIGSLQLPTLGLESAYEKQAKFAPILSPGVTPRVVAEKLGELNCCWVLDDFHKIAEQDKTQLAQLMKLFVDMSNQFPSLRLIFVGAVNTARDVIQYDPELRDRVAEIHVPLMSRDELREILTKGEECLKIRFDQRIAERIVEMANGLAAPCHQLALNFCRARGIETTRPSLEYLDTTGWTQAIEEYLQASSDTLRLAFDKSTKSFRKRKFDNGRLILQALTKFPQDGATHGDLLGEIRKRHGDYPPGNLATYLKALQREERGAIVSVDETSGKYYFSEPIYRAFCYSAFNQTSLSASKPLEMEKLLADLIPSIAKLVGSLKV